MTEQLVTSQLAQPPTFELQLFDAERKVGWVSPYGLGFRGFASEEEAMHAAYLAHRTLSRRLAHRHGRRPIPVATEPLTVNSDDTLCAAGRPIGAVVRPGPKSKSGLDSFGFELPFTDPVEEVTARSKCAHVYHALRRSGIRWAMWRTERPARPVRPAVSPPAIAPESVEPQPAMPWLPWWLGAAGLS